MEVDYASALQQLEAMFPNFDDETFRTVLASNDGHLERTIEDLIKLANEVENAPDDDENLFAEPTRKNVSNVYNDPDYQSNRHAKDAQESADAKMAYELQMQYLQENQNAGGGVNQHQHHQNQNQQYNPPNYASNGGGSYGSHNVAGSYDGIQGFHPVDAPQQNDPVKKKGFYKKLKLSVKNMLSRKGKGGKKGPTRNPGLYAEMDENLNPNNPLEDEPDMFKVKEDDDNEPAMKLSDIMNKPHNAEDNYSPRDEYINQRSYDNNNDRYGKNQNRNDYNQRAEYPPVNRHNDNEYYSDNYYEQH